MPSPTTSLLVTLLKDSYQQRKPLTFEEMSDYVHLDVQFKARNALSSALRIVQREEGMIFESIPSKGYKPVFEGDLADHARVKRQSKIRSQTQKWRSEYETINPAALDNQEYNAYVFSGLALSLQEQTISPETNKLIKDHSKAIAQNRDTEALALAMTSDAFEYLKTCC